MSFSGAQVTRLGLYGGSRVPYGSFAGKVATPPVFAGTIPDISITEGAAATEYDLSTYFTGAASYSIAPAVEAGWSFNTSTGVLTVDPLVVGVYGDYTVTATNAGGNTDSNAFGVTVTEGQFSGGFWFDYDAEYSRRRREEKKRLEAEEAAQKIQDELEREIALEFRKQDAENDRVNELARLTALTEKHRSQVDREFEEMDKS